MSENAEQLNKKAFEVANGSSFSRVSDEEVLRVLTTLDSGVRPDLSRRFYRVVKRAFDIVASGSALLVLLAPSLLLSAAICLKSPGASPLYSQMRVGRLRKDGTCKLFRMWKFRSMVPNADKLLDELREHNEADGPLFKIKNESGLASDYIRRSSMVTSWDAGTFGANMAQNVPESRSCCRVLRIGALLFFCNQFGGGCIVAAAPFAAGSLFGMVALSPVSCGGSASFDFICVREPSNKGRRFQ